MMMSDVICACGASYRRAESTSRSGERGHFDCAECGATIETWDQPKLIVHRLIVLPMRNWAPPATGRAIQQEFELV
jgi:hypothetical protein